MTSKPSTGRLQHIVIASALLLCSAVIFYMYYKPTMSWLPCSDTALPKQDVCTEECLRILKVENQTQIITNCTSVQEKTPTTQSPVLEKEDTTNTHEPEIVVLVWKWPFGVPFDLESCESNYGIKGCRLTLDRNEYDKAHAVMFHVRDIGGEVSNLQTLSRPPRQKWVWMNMESPANSPRLPGADDLFNLTSNYRRDSDIWVPYGQLIDISEKDEPFKIPEKNKLVCWIVSNWNGNLKRVGYFNELSQHIKVEAYGRHFGRYINSEDYSQVVSSCKFYLSFENSVYIDYITEKLFNPMRLGTVPVVLGASRENYEEFVPKDSFIHVDDFKTAQELAEHLKLLDQNQEMYEKYFAWRKDYVVKNSNFGQEHACRICDHVRRYKNYRVFKNVNKWYWG
ncbi:4-galactosyl-N-acetylglucosaminide 3-alpha-L-fucosyltransferase 9-like [Colossoma macropomum]|uniref:4-galactosyl-N-acetylglucosaminide 3-alpha-L-fucosyltransferase 9-like n=1 Tax=Colossoma macropomum TaxID=42526 RepID=UPI001864AE23|nr:4-galactosyl-N-acetylglucosaminide 3-alpha-L-fucosyltransferase 9-like [Colossoma macropomum]